MIHKATYFRSIDAKENWNYQSMPLLGPHVVKCKIKRRKNIFLIIKYLEKLQIYFNRNRKVIDIHFAFKHLCPQLTSMSDFI